MKLIVDSHHLLCVEHSDIPQIKQYTYQIGGYQFSDRDKGMVVLHKKNFKLMNLKHLGDGMNLVYVKEKRCLDLNIDKNCVAQAFGLFTSFDEVSGDQKYFWPGARGDISFMVPVPCNWDLVSIVEKLSFLYGILLLYGKFESKGSELLSIKIQLPLFGQYLKYQENLDAIILGLQQEGFFLKQDLVDTNNGIIYQISSNDWELLEIFAKWYEAIEKFEKISKKAFTEEMKNKLVAFLLSDNQIPENGRQNVLDQLQSGIVKFLMKS